MKFEYIKKHKRELATFLSLPIVFGIAKYVSPENLAFHGMNPHPYLIICVLLSSLYGLLYSLVISLSFSALYLVLLNAQLDYEKVESLNQIEYLVLPFSLIVISIIIGDIKERDKKRIETLMMENKEKEISLKVQTVKNDILLKQEHSLRRQLVTKLDTTDSLYNMAKKFSTVDFDELYQSIVEIISEQLNAKSIGIYKIQSDSKKLNLKKSHSSENRLFKSEIPLDNRANELILRTLETGKISTIQNISNRESFNNYSDKEPLLVGPLWDGKILYGVVVVHDIPFLDYVPHNFRLFKLFCNWASHSITSALQFNALSRNTILDDRFSVYKYSYFLDRLHLEMDNLKSEDEMFSVLKIDILDFNDIPSEKRIPVKQTLCKIIETNFRSNECVSTGQKYEEIYILLPGHNGLEAKNRMNKVREQVERLSEKSYEKYYRIATNIHSFQGKDSKKYVLDQFKMDTEYD